MRKLIVSGIIVVITIGILGLGTLVITNNLKKDQEMNNIDSSVMTVSDDIDSTEKQSVSDTDATSSDNMEESTSICYFIDGSYQMEGDDYTVVIDFNTVNEYSSTFNVTVTQNGESNMFIENGTASRSNEGYIFSYISDTGYILTFENLNIKLNVNEMGESPFPGGITIVGTYNKIEN